MSKISIIQIKGLMYAFLLVASFILCFINTILSIHNNEQIIKAILFWIIPSQFGILLLYQRKLLEIKFHLEYKDIKEANKAIDRNELFTEIN